MKYVVYIFIISVFIGCGSSSTNTSDDNKTDTNKTTPIIIPIKISNENNKTILDKINVLRVASGMVKLTSNNELNISSYNHALYLDSNNISGHDENNTKQNFTGVNPVDRTIISGFKSRLISENLSVGQDSEDLSLKGLMSAIYHRFGFLDFNINTIGYGSVDKTYVYNMGNSDLNLLCNDGNYTGNNAYTYNVCSDTSFRIESNIYNNKLNQTRNANPSYVIYPYNNETNVTTVFYEESPDPLPTYGVSGYPISVEFNKNEYNMSNFSINSFIIYDNDNNVLELASDFNDSNNILSKVNDINLHLDEYKFAIFPKNVLDYNTKYKVEFSYNYIGTTKLIQWNFTTENLPNLIIYNNNGITMQTNILYNIYIAPSSKIDTFNSMNISCSYSGNIAPSYVNNFYDANTISLKISGDNISTCTLTVNKDLSNERIISINIQ